MSPARYTAASKSASTFSLISTIGVQRSLPNRALIDVTASTTSCSSVLYAGTSLRDGVHTKMNVNRSRSSADSDHSVSSARIRSRIPLV